MTDAPPRTLEVRHLQLVRALFAAIAAIMITFSADHSAQLGLAVFSGFAIATSLAFLLSAWLVFPAGSRAVPVLLGIVTGVAGMVTGIPPLRSTVLFFSVVIAWAAISGIIELVGGLRARRARDPHARDGVLIGAVTIALALGLLVVNPGYDLHYVIDGAGEFALTGIAIGVGVFGGYAAIVAVFLGIAGFSPRPAPVDSEASTTEDAPSPAGRQGDAAAGQAAPTAGEPA
ncbi:acyl-CoA synthetase [Microbacterium flavum]|uniref:Acyl-CoA synthetase n=1 Tax=Microbacterium flavum TaxID=415216 RepID=A0ABS5XY09_9MICO|nr:acyl-CoA synthetase [Microbacterium flavum]MBT8797988.1 acyl-CoA synthetase [Microbacterium flavum]